MSTTVDRLSYLILTLDEHLSSGLKPDDAWSKALAEYAYVYHTDDGRLPLARAAELALAQMKKEQEERND